MNIHQNVFICMKTSRFRGQGKDPFSSHGPKINHLNKLKEIRGGSAFFYEQDVISLKCAYGEKCPTISRQKQSITQIPSNVSGPFDVLDCPSVISVILFTFPDYFIPFRQTNKPFFCCLSPPGDCFADGDLRAV